MSFGAIFDIISEYWKLLLGGIGITLLLSVVGTIIGLLIAFVFSIIRVQTVNSFDSKFKKIIKIIGVGTIKTYVNIIRGTPMIVQAVLFYYGFAQLGVNWSPLVAGLFTVSVNTAAYLTEVLRGGIQSVDKGQLEAARAIGMSQGKAMFLVIIPQALKNSFASIGNELIVNIKDTAVLNILSVVDLFTVTKNAAGKTYFYLEAMLIAAAIYLFLTYFSSKLLMYFERKVGAPVKEITSCN
jgi:putative lysine transport system permease protein